MFCQKSHILPEHSTHVELLVQKEHFISSACVFNLLTNLLEFRLQEWNRHGTTQFRELFCLDRVGGLRFFFSFLFFILRGEDVECQPKAEILQNSLVIVKLN